MDGLANVFKSLGELAVLHASVGELLSHRPKLFTKVEARWKRDTRRLSKLRCCLMMRRPP